MVRGKHLNFLRLLFILVRKIYPPSRLFTVLYFSVRSSRLSALCYGLPSCMSVKIIPDVRHIGTFENQDTRDGKTRYI